LKTVIDKIWPVIKEFLEWFEEKWDELVKLISDLWEKYGQPTFDKIAETIESLEDTFKDVWDSIKKITDEIKVFLEKLWESVKNLIDKFVAYFKTQFDFAIIMFKDIVFAIGEVFKLIAPIIESVLKKIGDGISALIDMVAGVVEGLTKILRGFIDFITGVFSSDWKRAWEGIVQIFKGIMNVISSIIEGVVNAIIGVINAFIRGINLALSLIPDFVWGDKQPFKITEIQKVQIQRFGTGGIVDKPTVGLLGEYANAQTNPEIVAPQSLMYDTIIEANGELVDAINQIADRIIRAMVENKTEVNIGDDEIARSARRGNERMAKMTNVRENS